MKKVFAALMAGVVVAVSIVPLKANASTEQRLRLSNRLLVINVGRNRMVRANKKVEWQVSNSSIAEIQPVGKKKINVIGKKKGSCVVTGISGKKKVSVKITVKEG